MKRKGAIVLLLPIALLLGTVALSLFSRPVVIHNTAELAKYTDCQPEYIREWLQHDFTYKLQGDIYPSGDVCIAAGHGDCKCYAAISADTLNQCPGYSAHLACMRSGPIEAHCLTYFTGPKGERGLINSGAQAETYPAGTDWAYIERQVSGGPWVTP